MPLDSTSLAAGIILDTRTRQHIYGLTAIAINCSQILHRILQLLRILDIHVLFRPEEIEC